LEVPTLEVPLSRISRSKKKTHHTAVPFSYNLNIILIIRGKEIFFVEILQKYIQKWFAKTEKDPFEII
jgi:hypothetical protein